jgi:DNA-binding response OmpR family regulator
VSETAPANPRSVLVVDDDPDIRDLVTMKIASAGFDVRTAADGEAALTAARAFMPDLVLLDRMMPGLDGLQVCRMLRADPDLDRTLVLMLTAKARESDVRDGFAAGADGYITKPFSPCELLARVEWALRPRD